MERRLEPVWAYWKEPSQANREALRMFVAPLTTIWQYTHGVPDTTRAIPDLRGRQLLRRSQRRR